MAGRAANLLGIAGVFLLTIQGFFKLFFLFLFLHVLWCLCFLYDSFSFTYQPTFPFLFCSFASSRAGSGLSVYVVWIRWDRMVTAWIWKWNERDGREYDT